MLMLQRIYGSQRAKPYIMTWTQELLAKLASGYSEAQGVKLLTLAASDDVVVTPADAVIAPLHERDWYVLSSKNVVAFGGGGTGVPLGHGPLLDNTLAWIRMAKVIGPQEPRAA